jgi:hypothetical protein
MSCDGCHGNNPSVDKSFEEDELEINIKIFEMLKELENSRW